MIRCAQCGREFETRAAAYGKDHGCIDTFREPEDFSPLLYNVPETPRAREQRVARDQDRRATC